MQQRVDTPNIDESAVIGEAADHAAHRLTLDNFRVAALLGGALFLFANDAAVDHHIFLGHVELDDAAANLLPY